MSVDGRVVWAGDFLFLDSMTPGVSGSSPVEGYFFPFLNCILVFVLEFLVQMFKFINMMHLKPLMTIFNTCQNLLDGPFKHVC